MALRTNIIFPLTTTYTNELASAILVEDESRRLKRFKPTDLTTKFS
jgi:hypothetical protein